MQEWLIMGWDALVVLIHTQGIGDNPSKSTSGKGYRTCIGRGAEVKGQSLATAPLSLQATPASPPNTLMGGPRPATHANKPY